jgi:hypothetical protein
MSRNDELKMQAECFRWLRSMGVFCHSIPNEADGRSIVAQMQLMAAGLTPGVADMLVWWPVEGGEVRLGYLEFKTAKGKQSDYQKAFEKKCASVGLSYDLARSLEDVKEIYLRRVKS